MLELLGRGYVINHCVSTLNAVRRAENYQIYLTEILRAISKGVGYEIKYSYMDLLNETKGKPEEERTADEVINTIKAKAMVINNGSIEPQSEDNA